MPEPDDIIILEPGEERWTYRYAAEPDLGSQRQYGYTFCCNRSILVPTNAEHVVATLNVPSNWPVIDDCCERPFALHGHKQLELPPYSGEHTTCPKCGSKAVETKYTTQAMEPFGIPRVTYPNDWLARRCVVCRAKWDEAVVAELTGAEAAAKTTPHDAAPWSVWGIGDTWWVHHSASGMFLPIVRGGEMLTPAELVEAGARPLGRGGAVDA